jgi:hypothetical protein
MKTRRNKKTMRGGARKLQEIESIATFMSNLTACAKKPRDPTSLSSLVARDISQSTAIKLGNVLEELFNLAMVDVLGKSYVRPDLKRNEKGERQKDVLMVNDTTGHVIYGEMKSNINLDTQKVVSTVQSTIEVVNYFKENRYQVSGYLISLRYLDAKDIPTSLARKYSGFKEHPDIALVGIREFMEAVTHVSFEELSSEAEYGNFLTTIANLLEVCS